MADSPFETAALASRAAFQSVFGETVSYTPSGGSLRSVTGIVERRPEAIDYDPDGEGLMREITVHLPDDDTDGVARGSVSLGLDLVTVDGVDWAVVEIMDHSGGMIGLRCTRREPKTLSAADYRIKRS